jgi:AcrR family transcriptional regulator
MGRRPAHTSEEIIEIALRLVEQDGLEALTIRDIGTALGVGHMTVYTHFADKQALIDALVAHAAADVMTRTVPESAGPRSQLCDIARRVRAVFSQHPHLAPAILHASGRIGVTHELSRSLLAELRRAGLDGRKALVAHRVLENYIAGTSVFDFGGAPHHLSSRAERHRQVDPQFFESVATEEAVGQLNEEAYMIGFEVLLDGFGVRED